MCKEIKSKNNKEKQNENNKLLADAINTNQEVPLLVGGSVPIAKDENLKTKEHKDILKNDEDKKQ